MTVTALPSPAAGRPRTVRWLLRLHRPALYAWAGLVAVLAGALLWLGGPLTDAAAAAWREYDAGCARGGPCSYDQDAILRYKDVYQYTTFAVLAVPFLVAGWAGAALTGRELESGTARLAWTQAVTPARWLAARLAVPAALVTAGTGLLVLLHHRAWTAGDGRIETAKTWYDMPTFVSGGPLVLGLALAGLVIGALLGLLLGRSLVALCAAPLAVAALWTAVQTGLPHLWPAATRVAGRRTFPEYSGIKVEEGVVTSTGAHETTLNCLTDATTACRRLNDRRGVTGFYVDYHPFSHYWPLHLAATGLLLALTALLTVPAFLLLRRRTTGTPGRTPRRTPGLEKTGGAGAAG
ncbi:ABC transporter permease [Streptomyces sp. NPDC017095]|uniref:ABC transporter permease n=1 Tax=Streptomyces sp. NPDC017095 TaxID=3364977 RepID=UPI0037934869